MKILLIEDDETVINLLEQALTANHYTVNIATDGETGLQLAQTYDFDLILLDILIPKLDGISLCRQLRDRGYQMPILLLTALDDSRDRVAGFEAGADDYVVKPFDLPELIARIKALLRRGKEISATVLSWEMLQLNPDTRSVTYQGKLLYLTPKEYGLLELFLRHPERIFSRSAILDRIWSIDEFPSEDAVTTQIKGLRQKLKAAGIATNPIETVYGMGYRLNREAEAKSKKEKPTQNSEKEREDRQAQAEVMAVMAAMWANYSQSITSKLALFEDAIAYASTGILDNDLRQQAHSFAHQLVGSLGSYGLPDGSQVAREIEKLLRNSTTLDRSAALQLQTLVESLKEILQKQPQLEITSVAVGKTEKLDSPKPQLLIVDDDMALAERIKLEAVSWGLQVEVATNPTIARNKLALHLPDVILLDLSFPHAQENGLTLLAELSLSQPEIPVLVFTASNELERRVEVARLGAYNFLHKTMSPASVLSAVNNSLQQHSSIEAKIMVVDDDPAVLVRVKSLLLPWGMKVTTIQDPQQFWQVLEIAAPNLIILDVEMPHFSGIELCQAVRNDPRWHRLPILFLSAHSNSEIVHQVYAAGADDYVPKPIVEPELIARILNRLERTQLWEKLEGKKKEL